MAFTIQEILKLNGINPDKNSVDIHLKPIPKRTLCQKIWCWIRALFTCSPKNRELDIVTQKCIAWTKEFFNEKHQTVTEELYNSFLKFKRIISKNQGSKRAEVEKIIRLMKKQLTKAPSEPMRPSSSLVLQEVKRFLITHSNETKEKKDFLAKSFPIEEALKAFTVLSEEEKEKEKQGFKNLLTEIAVLADLCPEDKECIDQLIVIKNLIADLKTKRVDKETRLKNEKLRKRAESCFQKIEEAIKNKLEVTALELEKKIAINLSNCDSQWPYLLVQLFKMKLIKIADFTESDQVRLNEIVDPSIGFSIFVAQSQDFLTDAQSKGFDREKAVAMKSPIYFADVKSQTGLLVLNVYIKALEALKETEEITLLKYALLQLLQALQKDKSLNAIANIAWPVVNGAMQQTLNRNET